MVSSGKTCPAPVDPEGFMVRTALSLGIYLGESHYHPHTSNYPYTPLASTITNE